MKLTKPSSEATLTCSKAELSVAVSESTSKTVPLKTELIYAESVLDFAVPARKSRILTAVSRVTASRSRSSFV